MGRPKKTTPENFIKDVRRSTRRIFTAEQKILIVMEALRAENSIAEICRKHSINVSGLRTTYLPEVMRLLSVQL